MHWFEAWHLWALGSLVVAGANAFIVKVAAERTHVSTWFSALTSAVSTVCAVVAALVFGFDDSLGVVAFGAAAGVFLALGLIARSDGLTHVHATIFFPIYKIAGPALVLASGLFLFHERLTAMQAIGIVLVFAVPLLLIDRLEHVRQNDLFKGVLLAIVSALFISTTQVMSKFAASPAETMRTFMVFDYAFASLGALVLYMRSGGGRRNTDMRRLETVYFSVLAGATQFVGFLMLIIAYRSGPISTIYAINSTYIVIPIVLSIWFYGEHWNLHKAIAVVLSVVAVVLLR
jgi:uncharacterized membrane protein